LDTHGPIDRARRARRAPGPDVAHMIEGDRTPVMPKDLRADLGFWRILCPLTGSHRGSGPGQEKRDR
jgi:hypothetical protein